MKQYEGTHNFHNFTVGKPFKDTSANRFMIKTIVSDPFVIEGTEWISIKFMVNHLCYIKLENDLWQH